MTPTGEGGMASFKELDVVRVARLLQPFRPFHGSEGASRPPQVGDQGAIVAVYDQTVFCVECVASDGMTIWLADFALQELELVWTPQGEYESRRKV
jgi:hypothetical protein